MNKQQPTNNKMNNNNNNSDTDTTPLNLAQLASLNQLTINHITPVDKITLQEIQHSGQHLLYWVSCNCNVELLQAMLDKGVDVDQLTISDWTPLMGAISGKKFDNAMLLLNHGANPKLVTSYYKNSPLHHAAEVGAPDELIIALLHAGANYKAANKDGKTAIDIANHHHHFSITKIIEEFANPPTKSANFLV
jgi:ankyrin repeat protein